MASPGRSWAASLAAALLVLTSTGTALAQDTAGDPDDSNVGAPCSGWGGILPAAPDSRIATCVLPMITAADLASTYPGLPIAPPLMGADTRIFMTDDPDADQFLLVDGSVPGDTDPATDLDRIYHATFELDNAGARDLRDWFGGLRPADARVTTGLPLRRVIQPGGWEWFFLKTKGDPTTPPDAPRVFQIAFQGPPGRSVPAVFPDTNPLDGARNIVHYRQDPNPDGEVRDSDMWTDAGSQRAGADGSIYYNTPPGITTITSPHGVQFFVPKEADPLGAFRPEAWDSEAWDFGSTSEAPTAFVPTSGQAPAVFDLVVVLNHDKVPNQTFTYRSMLQTSVTLPSAFLGTFISSLLSQLEPPVPLELRFDFEGDELVFRIDAAPLPGVPSGFTFVNGLVGYGSYCFEGLSVPLDGSASWADGAPISAADAAEMTDLGPHFRRVLGTACVRVTEAPGPLHWSAHQPWFMGHGPSGYDPEAELQWLADIGWVDDG